MSTYDDIIARGAAKNEGADASGLVPKVVGDLRPSDELRRETRSRVDQRGSIRTRFCVIGPRGAVTFTLRTGGGWDDLAWGIDSHTPEAQYPDSQTPNDCDLLPGGKCYSDGSALQASELWEAVKRRGGAHCASDEELIWRTLEDRYARWIEGQEDKS